jgi:predicted TIM-barrel fold metal-dependent hydrolase
VESPDSAQQAAEDALARIHREYRDECIKLGVYRGIDPKAVEREIERWKKECSRPPRRPDRKRKHPPVGHAD